MIAFFVFLVFFCGYSFFLVFGNMRKLIECFNYGYDGAQDAGGDMECRREDAARGFES